MARHLITLFLALLGACSATSAQTTGGDSIRLPLPDISSFATTPSDTFIVSDAAMAGLSMATPFAGKQSGCPHEGAHVQFLDRQSPYTIDVFAPADGQIARVENCLDIGNNDRYGLVLKFASHADEDVNFAFSIEPMGGHLCGDDPHFYEKYIHVREGDWVKKGTRVAELLHPGKTNGGTHIHFHLGGGGPRLSCPNIFNERISTLFHDSRNGFQCGGKDWSTLCFAPDPGQDLVHGR